MTTVNISMPQRMRKFLEAQVAGGSYSSTSEYLRALIREEQKRQALARLEEELLRGLDSGGRGKLGPKDWEAIRRRLRQRHGRRGSR